MKIVKSKVFSRLLALVMMLSALCTLAACGGSDSKNEFTESQKEDIKGILYDIVPKCLFSVTNAEIDTIEYLMNSDHVTEEFRETVINDIEEKHSRYSKNLGDAYIRT